MLGRFLRILVVSLVAASTLSVSPGAADDGPWKPLGGKVEPGYDVVDPDILLTDLLSGGMSFSGSHDPRVSLSDDGTRVAIARPEALVTASGIRTGIVRVYDLIPATSKWKQVSGNLFAQDSEQTFGSSISLSGDGSLLAVAQHPTDEPDDAARHAIVDSAVAEAAEAAKVLAAARTLASAAKRELTTASAALAEAKAEDAVFATASVTFATASVTFDTASETFRDSNAVTDADIESARVAINAARTTFQEAETTFKEATSEAAARHATLSTAVDDATAKKVDRDAAVAAASRAVAAAGSAVKAANDVGPRDSKNARSVQLFDLSETGTTNRRTPISNAFPGDETKNGLDPELGFGKSVSLSDDGSRIAVSSENNIRVYDLTDGPTTLLGLTTIPVTNGKDAVRNSFPAGSGAVLSGDGLRVAFVPAFSTPTNPVLHRHQVEVYHLTDATAPVWNRVGSFTATKHGFAAVESLALDKDGSTLVVGIAAIPSADPPYDVGRVEVYDQATHVWKKRLDKRPPSADSLLQGLAFGDSVSVSDDGSRVAIGGTSTGRVIEYDSAKGSWQAIQFPDPDPLNTNKPPLTNNVPGEKVSLSANGRTLATAPLGGTVKVWVLNHAPVFNTVTVTQSKTGLPLATASDADGDTITYSLDPAAQSVFNIDAATGQVTFKTAPVYDPADASNNSHTFTVTASDGQEIATKKVSIVVTETAVFRSPANPACAVGAQQPHGFNDVAGSFAHADITCIAALGVTVGTSDTTYSPARKVTREEMAAFLGRLYRNVTGKECAATDHGFGDVPSTSYANGDVGCLKNLKVVTAAEGFRPSDDLTRLEAGQMMARLYREISGEDDCSADAHGFTDVASVTEDAQKDIRCIKATGITTGTSATAYSPGKTMTREMMAAFLARLYRLVIV